MLHLFFELRASVRRLEPKRPQRSQAFLARPVGWHSSRSSLLRAYLWGLPKISWGLVLQNPYIEGSYSGLVLQVESANGFSETLLLRATSLLLLLARYPRLTEKGKCASSELLCMSPHTSFPKETLCSGMQISRDRLYQTVMVWSLFFAHPAFFYCRRGLVDVEFNCVAASASQTPDASPQVKTSLTLLSPKPP